MAKRGEKDWRTDIHNYLRRESITIVAMRTIVGDAALATQLFADEYRDDMSTLAEEETPPCVECPDRTIYFCYLTSTECRKWRVWDGEMR